MLWDCSYIHLSWPEFVQDFFLPYKVKFVLQANHAILFLNGSCINMKNLLVRKTYNDILETYFVERCIQGVQEFWTVEQRCASSMTMELCSKIKITNINSYRYGVLLLLFVCLFVFPGNASFLKILNTYHHLSLIINLFLYSSLLFCNTASLLILSCFITFLISSHISLFYLLLLFPNLSHFWYTFLWNQCMKWIK